MDWLYHANDVIQTEIILGRGAYGEVRVGLWRNIKIACKKLFAQDLIFPSNNEELSKEITLLSKLRHPNLVLFLGVTLHPDTQRPSTILTELMPYSLYDLLEIKKVILSFEETVELSYDVINGLEYLHKNDPVIVHRDISSKNILISNNHAKIADFGQAKIFETGRSSRNTSMPGAMAYAAPEVLTGKYSEMIDIFSFGILLIQMVINDYPRIERRNEQMDKACMNAPILENVIRSSLCYMPTDRPTASVIHDDLERIMSNDAYYNPSRKLLPENEMGILTRRYLINQIEKNNQDMNKTINRLQSRLTAEEKRWHNEANRADNLYDEINLKNKHIHELESTVALQHETIQTFQNDLQTLRTEQTSLLHIKKDLYDQLNVSENQIQALKDKERNLQESLDVAMVSLADQQKQYDDLQVVSYDQAKIISEYAMKLNELQVKLNEEKVNSLELNARLDQTLYGWTKEKELNKALDERNKKIISQCNELSENNVALNKKIDTLTARLDQYSTLPMPDEIKMRFQDMKSDLEETGRVVANLESIYQTSCQEKTHLESVNQNLLNEIKEKEANIEHLHFELSLRQNDIHKLKENNLRLTGNTMTLQDQITTLQNNNNELTKKNLELEKTVTELNESLEREYERFNNMVMNVSSLSMKGTALSLMQLKRNENNALVVETIPSNENENQRIDDANPLNEIESTDHQDKEVVDETDEEHLRRVDKGAKLKVEHVKNTEGLEGLIQLLKDDIVNINDIMCWRCIREIREYLVQSQDNKALCLEHETELRLIDMMFRWPNILMVQTQSMRVLAALAFGNDRIRRRTGEKKVIEAIVDAMERFGDDDSLMLHACTVLTNLTHNSMENRHRFLETSGMEILVTQMDRHRLSSKIQRQACWTILTLSGSDETARDIVGRGGISAVFNALTNHRNDTNVQVYGCWAISNMALAGEDVRRKLRKMGAIEVCRMALENHSDNTEVIKQARHAIGVLGSKPLTSSANVFAGLPENTLLAYNVTKK